MSNKRTVAVLGAGGTMGSAIASNLARGGFTVKAWNRDADKLERLKGGGAHLAATPAEAAEGAAVVLTMLSDAEAVLSVMEGDDGALASAADGSVWLQMSTIGLEGIERCIELANENNLVLIDAPVLGTKQPAEQGELKILASGPLETHELLQPLFDEIGNHTMWIGDEPGASSRLKVVINSWIVTVVEGAAETIALAEGIGVDPEGFLEAIRGGPLELGYLNVKARAMTARSFDPAFRLALAAKDAALVKDAADEAGLDLPVLEAIRARLEEGIPEHGEEDLAATFLMSAPA